MKNESKADTDMNRDIDTKTDRDRQRPTEAKTDTDTDTDTSVLVKYNEGMRLPRRNTIRIASITWGTPFEIYIELYICIY